MNAAQVHLLFNHVPVFGLLIGGLILITGLFLKNETVNKVGLYVLLITALLTIPAYLSGDDAEHLLKGPYGLDRELIHHHEDTAQVAFIAILITGAFAGISLWRLAKNQPARTFIFITIAVGLFAYGSVAWSAHLGGEIRHPELIHSPQADS